MKRLALALALVAGAAAVAVAAGDWGGEREDGTARLWITRDRGQAVLTTTTVPAGITAMQALDRVAKIETRYGGRFVQSIDGLAGSASARSDWFYFINGYEGDRSAAEYRLRDGDVEWWDYRRWTNPGEARLVVGAFPEPFLHGYAGKRRPAVVMYSDRSLAGDARAIARLLGAKVQANVEVRAKPPPDANVLQLVRSAQDVFYAPRHDSSAGDGVVFVFGGDAGKLARNPDAFRFRYEVRP